MKGLDDLAYGHREGEEAPKGCACRVEMVDGTILRIDEECFIADFAQFDILAPPVDDGRSRHSSLSIPDRFRIPSDISHEHFGGVLDVAIAELETVDRRCQFKEILEYDRRRKVLGEVSVNCQRHCS